MKTTKRQKKTVISGVTRETAEEAFARYAKADASINKIQAEIDLACTGVRERYQQQLGSLECERACAFDTLQAFAVEHQAELFSRKKSLEMSHGVIGFRTGTPKLKTMKGFTWASALELVRTILGSGYIRRTEELAKDRLLADRDIAQVTVIEPGTTHGTVVPMAEALARCGLMAVQDENFYVEPIM